MPEGTLNAQRISIGTVLNGRYRIDARLGEGGMGTVYKAFDTTLERDVAIKVLTEQKRLSQEISALAALQNPHIVGIHAIEVEQQLDRPIIILEFIHGRTLAEIVESSGPLPTAECVRIAQEALTALEHAHSKNIIHRDLKPQNMMLDERNQLRLLDFGLAKLLGMQEQRVTQTGEIIGSVYYISPEQCQSGSITPQTDIYALGASLYFLVTGKPPFEGKNPLEICLKQTQDAPDLHTVPDERLAQIIDKAMQKDPQARFSSAQEMADALSTHRNLDPVPFSAKSVQLKPSIRAKNLIPPVVAAGAIAALGIWQVSRPPDVHNTADPAESTPIDTETARRWLTQFHYVCDKDKSEWWHYRYLERVEAAQDKLSFDEEEKDRLEYTLVSIANQFHQLAEEEKHRKIYLTKLYGQNRAAWEQLAGMVECLMFAPSRLAAGTTLAGRYAIQGILGAGGMGAVYRARDLQLEREVALKVLTTDSRRLDKEAAAMAQLTHPHIVKIHSVDIDESDRKFLVLEYVEGTTLREVVEKNGPLSPDRAIELTLQILDAVEHAHAQGIIHRDLKPQNIMLDAGGNAKILDFGIAKLIGTDGQRLTQTGDIIGTPEYISPEQCTAGDITPRTDLYAVACCLHFMLTSKAPFHGDSVMEIFLKQVHEIPTLSKIPDKAVAAIVEKALAKKPEQRYQTAAEMAEALRTKTAPSKTPKAEHGSHKRIPPLRVVASITGALVLGITIGILLAPHYAPVRPQGNNSTEQAYSNLKVIAHHVYARELSNYDMLELKRLEPYLTAPSTSVQTQVDYEGNCIIAYLLMHDMPEYFRHARQLCVLKAKRQKVDHAVVNVLLSMMSRHGLVVDALQLIDFHQSLEPEHLNPLVRRMFEYDTLIFAKKHRLLPLFQTTEKALAAGDAAQADLEMLQVCRDQARKKLDDERAVEGDFIAATQYLESPHSYRYPALRAHAYITWGDALRLEGNFAGAKNRYEHALAELQRRAEKSSRRTTAEWERLLPSEDIQNAEEGLYAVKRAEEDASAPKSYVLDPNATNALSPFKYRMRHYPQ